MKLSELRIGVEYAISRNGKWGIRHEHPRAAIRGRLVSVETTPGGLTLVRFLGLGLDAGRYIDVNPNTVWNTWEEYQQEEQSHYDGSKAPEKAAALEKQLLEDLKDHPGVRGLEDIIERWSFGSPTLLRDEVTRLLVALRDALEWVEAGMAE